MVPAAKTASMPPSSCTSSFLRALVYLPTLPSIRHAASPPVGTRLDSEAENLAGEDVSGRQPTLLPPLKPSPPDTLSSW